MKFHNAEDVRLILPQAALTTIFDECDGFDQDETGGRIIGTFKENGGTLTLHINGVIESGPQARRSSVSFFQDGEHQERIFRKVEASHPEIEHLGNWHTHHVNGYPHLSGGDITTYQRTVNHPNHNTPFFYALLVVSKRKTKDPLHRYSVKHYILHRNDERAYEIPERMVEIVDTQILWPVKLVPHAQNVRHHSNLEKIETRPERVLDRDVLSEFYRELRPFTSAKLGFYWRGPIELLDGSKVQVALVEDSSTSEARYSIVLRDAPDALKAVAEQLAKREFPSARAALIITERSCNRTLFEERRHSFEINSSR